MSDEVKAAVTRIAAKATTCALNECQIDKITASAEDYIEAMVKHGMTTPTKVERGRCDAAVCAMKSSHPHLVCIPQVHNDGRPFLCDGYPIIYVQCIPHYEKECACSKHWKKLRDTYIMFADLHECMMCNYNVVLVPILADC